MADVLIHHPSAHACPSCGAIGDPVHAGLVDRHFSAPGRWSLRGCEACGMVWIDPPPHEAVLDAAYRDYYTHGTDLQGPFERFVKTAIPAARLGYDEVSMGAPRWVGSLASLFGPLREIAEHSVMWLRGDQRGRLLDVGCGSGALLAQMRNLGWEVEGLETDEAAAAEARRRLGSVPVHEDFGGADGPRAGSFDAVTLSHVIEHLADPAETLAGCRDALRPGGLLSIATPNIESLGRERFGASWLHWDPPRHLRLYDRRGMRALLEDAGFRVQRIFSSAGSAHFVWQASWLLSREGRLPGIRLDSLPLRARLAGLAFWVREHARVRRGHDCGEELIALAERPPDE